MTKQAPTTICFANNKGGSGKSTTCANVGYSLSTMGYRVLLIDGDMQMNLALSFFPEGDVLRFAQSEKNLYYAIREQKELTDYIFKPGPDGVTGYQKQYMSDVLNLIESAYFTKYGDQLVKKANDAGQSKAYKDLHQKLAATRGKMRSSNAAGRGFNSDSDSLINAIGKHLL